MLARREHPKWLKAPLSLVKALHPSPAGGHSEPAGSMPAAETGGAGQSLGGLNLRDALRIIQPHERPTLAERDAAPNVTPAPAQPRKTEEHLAAELALVMGARRA